MKLSDIHLLLRPQGSSTPETDICKSSIGKDWGFRSLFPFMSGTLKLPTALGCTGAISMTGLSSASFAATNLPPIRIGSISTLSGGPALFAPAGLAAKAFFDEVNASGGIQSRKIEFLQEDDKGSPRFAAEAAEKLVGDPTVVAFAGGASLMECAVNVTSASIRPQRSVRNGVTGNTRPGGGVFPPFTAPG